METEVNKGFRGKEMQMEIGKTKPIAREFEVRKGKGRCEKARSHHCQGHQHLRTLRQAGRSLKVETMIIQTAKKE